MKRIFILVVLAVLFGSSKVSAQMNLAATLEVLAPGVTVQRVDTSNPIEVKVEAIVGVGDTIETGDGGRARITFFADGTTTELEPNTSYRIEEFKGNDESFTLRVSVITGQTIQQLGRVLDSNSSYKVETPGMSMSARGTIFAIRVENSGRSAMLVREGTVEASDQEDIASVPAEFGIRSAHGEELSDVVRAATFDELDSALDGCEIVVTTPDDLSINVRLGSSIEAPRIGFLDARDVTLVFGKNESGDWYRVAFEGSFGWFLSTSANIEGTCAGLREFPDSYSEDAGNYEPQAESTQEP
jgi:hypothetical protein